VRRRQDLIGTPRGSFIYDDFAHHPTAVRETLAALRSRHPGSKLFAVFEPRSATACRRMHQAEYTRAFRAADEVLLAPLGRSNLPAEEALDLSRLASDLNAGGTAAQALPGVAAIIDYLAANVTAGNVVILLSNGAFGGIHAKLLQRLG
jgi:UDP-N-acetylmuramate: L-alanyl-gamma-D-glutamyl-meso-diaminopimelate ligase